MRALIIGAEQRSAIAALVALAEANVTDVADAKAAAERDIDAYRAWMRQCSIELPRGYMVTYTHERQSFGVVRHISVSVDDRAVMPHPEAIEMILDEFGMTPLKQSLRIWIEEFDFEHRAVNIVQHLGAPPS
jgi:hypothetical protein